MLEVWEEWSGKRGKNDIIWEREIELYKLRDRHHRVSERVKLRFARVKQEVLDRLVPEDVYIPG
jgi:hypothetical protein